MTKEEIFQAYFSNPNVACEQQLTQQDLTFTNCGEVEQWTLRHLQTLDFKFTLLNSVYGRFERLCGCSWTLPDDFSLDQFFTTGEVSGWKLTGLDISSGVSSTEGNSFVSLVWLRDSSATFAQLDDYGRPLEENYVSLQLDDYDFKILLEQGTDYALLVEHHDNTEDSYVTHTVVTEIINGHKTRVFNGWFFPQEIMPDYAWEEFSYEVPAK